jgi:phosphatidylglycerol:prolipoprotein diacylglycerol transferase
MFNQHFGILHSSVLFYALDDCLDHLHAGNLLADGAMMDSLESGRMFYSVFMALAFVAFIAVRRLLPRESSPISQLDLRQQFLLATAAFVGGTMFAKIPFVLTSIGKSPGLLAWAADGKTVTAGLVGAYVCVEFTKRLIGITFKTGDSFALPLAVALAIGRLGCFFNGCCHGTATNLPWGVDFHGLGPMHPTQLYEVLFHASMAMILWHLTLSKKLATHRLQFYLIAYCIYRFITESIRPEPVFATGLTIFQWTMLLFGIGLAIQWITEVRTEVREDAKQELS